MKLFFTKSGLPLSVIIRAVTGEDCSHFLFVFENGVAFQSNLLGTGPVFWKPDKKKLTVVHEIDLPVSGKFEQLVWHRVINKYSDRPYDFSGALYLGWRVLLRECFAFHCQRKNPWHQKRAYFCDELYDCLKDVPGLPILDVTGHMETPHMVYERLCNLR